jgi:hypothetical protein
MSANDTTVTFPVMVPMYVTAEWAPNWSYILTVGLVGMAIAIPSTMLAKRRFRGWRSRGNSKTKNLLKKRGAVKQPQVSEESDLKLYNYIIGKGGSLKLADAMRALGMSREEITQAVVRLKEKHMLG